MDMGDIFCIDGNSLFCINKIVMPKKYIFITIVIIAGIVAGAITYNRYTEKKYIESVRGITNDMMNTFFIAKSITDRYIVIWQNAIEQGGDLNQTMVSAVADERVNIAKADSLLIKINFEVRDIHSVPSKYSELHQNIANLYTLVNELQQLSKQPQGSLNTFTESKLTNQAAVETLHKKIEQAIQ